MNKPKPLQEYRRELNVSQRQLADALQISTSAVAMYETGNRTPSLNTAKLIARFFHVGVDDILFGKRAGDQAL